MSASSSIRASGRSLVQGRLRDLGLVLLVAACALAALFGPVTVLDGRLGVWSALVVAICVQALPFLLLGALVAALVSVFAPEALLRALAPANPVLAVPAVAVSGVLLPGCECGSVPVSRSLIRRGVPEPAALAFLLAAPAINPVVLVSTAIAYQGDSRMVLARFGASLLAAMLVGWAWIPLGRGRAAHGEERLGPSRRGRLEAVRASMVADLLDAGGFLVLGAMAAAALKVLVPEGALAGLAEAPVLAGLAMAALAILLSLCSEADAFVAASFAVPASAQLVFLVVGPMIDLKLLAMQSGAWGTSFVLRFAPLVLASALASSLLVGAIAL